MVIGWDRQTLRGSNAQFPSRSHSKRSEKDALGVGGGRLGVDLFTGLGAGSALLPVLLLMLLFSAVALGLAVVVRIEIAVADRFVHAAEALHAAEAGLTAALSELRGLPDWTSVLDGTRRSAHAEGAFSGVKAVPRGGEVALCCGPESAAGRLAADTAASPLPARRALRWQPFLWTTFDSLVPADPPSRLLLVVWVADDETDGDADTTGDTNGAILVRAEALAPDGLRRIVEAYIGRVPADAGEEPPPETAAVQVLSWHEVR